MHKIKIGYFGDEGAAGEPSKQYVVYMNKSLFLLFSFLFIAAVVY